MLPHDVAQQLVQQLEAEATVSHTPVPSWITQHTPLNASPPDVCVQLPLPLAVLVTHGTWPRFSLWSDRQVGSGPAPFGFSEQNLAHPDIQLLSSVPPNDAPTGNASLTDADMAKALRAVQQALPAALQVGGGKEAGRLILDVMSTLQRRIDESTVQAYLKTSGNLLRLRRDNETILNFFMFAQSLKNTAHIRKALQHAARCLLPGPQAEELITHIEDGKSLAAPHAAIISRRRLLVDIAWMLEQRRVMRACLDQGCVVFIGADASPQGGRNYEMVSLRCVLVCNLRSVFVDFCRIIHLSNQPLGERLANVQDEAGLLQDIHMRITYHTPPPCIIGQGRGSLSQRFMKVCHSLALECEDFAMLSALLRSCRYWLADYGTEQSLARIRPIPLSEVLPWFPAHQALRTRNSRSGFC